MLKMIIAIFIITYISIIIIYVIRLILKYNLFVSKLIIKAKFLGIHIEIEGKQKDAPSVED